MTHIKSISVAVCACLLAVSPAQAGFEYTPPVQPAVPQAPMNAAPSILDSMGMEQAVAAPVAPVMEDPGILSPPPPAPMNIQPPRRLVIDPYPNKGAAPAMPSFPQSAMKAHAATPVMDDPIVQGFGRDLPLVTALSQIVPPEYTYNFARSVDQAAPVSWEGGAPWQDVLQTMLSGSGLYADITGNIITITKQPAPPVMRAPTMQAADWTPPPPPMQQPMAIPRASASSMSDAPRKGVMISRSTDLADTGPEARPKVAARVSRLNGGTVRFMDEPMMASSAPSSPVAPSFSAGWSANQGDSLRSVLTQWATREGIALQWNVTQDYPLKAPISVNSSFQDAVQTALEQFGTMNPQPYAELKVSNADNRPTALIIRTY